jgi:type I restriction enzyme R subunit
MQQALTYAEMLGVPSVYSSNGDGFLEHDRSGQQRRPEHELSVDAFPSPAELWKRYCTWKGISGASLPTVTQDYLPRRQRQAAALLPEQGHQRRG